MSTEKKIQTYINSQTQSKRSEMQTLHERVLQMLPEGRLWFLDGKDENGKVVTNPNIGYGQFNINYKNGATKEFYQIGISANTSGISVYIMGLENKKYLPETYGKIIGKASITGYCIKFKSLKNINIQVLEDAIQNGIKQTTKN